MSANSSALPPRLAKPFEQMFVVLEAKARVVGGDELKVRRRDGERHVELSTVGCACAIQARCSTPAH